MNYLRAVVVVAMLLVSISEANVKLTGTSECLNAPTASISISGGKTQIIELTGFNAESQSLYFGIFVADMTSDEKPVTVTYDSGSYDKQDTILSMQMSCPESGYPPVYIATTSAISSNESLHLPLYKSASFVFRVTLPSLNSSFPTVSLRFAEVNEGQRPGSFCYDAVDLVPERVLPENLVGKATGDTSLSVRQPNQCASGVIQQYQWFILRMPSNAESPVAMIAAVQPHHSFFEPEVEVFAGGDCSESATCIQSSVKVIERTARQVTWEAKANNEYLVRVTGNRDVNGMACGTFQVAVYPSGSSVSSLFSSSFVPPPVSSSTSSLHPSPVPHLSSSSSPSHNSGSSSTHGHSTSEVAAVIAFTVASLVVVGLVSFGVFWLYSKRKSREDSAAAAVQMTSAFGDVLDGINDDDDGDDDDAIFTFAPETSSVPSAEEEKNNQKQSLVLPSALEMPAASEGMFTIDGVDDLEDGIPEPESK